MVLEKLFKDLAIFQGFLDNIQNFGTMRTNLKVANPRHFPAKN
jgi:hypothetical protein